MSGKRDSFLRKIGQWRYPHSKFVCERDITLKQTNAFGNTYFANYVEWQGEAREKFLLQHPATPEFLRANPQLVLVTYCVFHRYIDNTYFGDHIRIEVTSKDIQKYSLILVFRYFNDSSNKVVGEGWQKVCFRDAQKGVLVEVPQLILDLVLAVMEKG